MFNLFKKPKSQGEQVREKKRLTRLKYIKNDLSRLNYRRDVVTEELVKINEQISDKIREFTELKDEQDRSQ